MGVLFHQTQNLDPLIRRMIFYRRGPLGARDSVLKVVLTAVNLTFSSEFALGTSTSLSF